QALKLILTNLIKIVEAQPEEEIILFLNSLLDMKKRESVEAVLGALKQTRLHKAFVYYAVKYNQEFDGQDETTYIAMILMGQIEQAIETAIAASENAKQGLADGQMGDKTEDLPGSPNGENSAYRRSIAMEKNGNKAIDDREAIGGYIESSENKFNTIEKCEETRVNKGNEANQENWQLDYAVIAILYSKRLDLYNKYKEYFSPVQNEIIEAYLSGRKIVKATEELNFEYEKIKIMLYYIFGQ
ncbi:MAG: hypothetical protein ACYDG2_21745, partial [Ruminiclostridium sp.]